MRWSAMLCDTLRCTAMRCGSPWCSVNCDLWGSAGAVLYNARRCSVGIDHSCSVCGALRCVAMLCGALRCSAIHCGALRCSAMLSFRGLARSGESAWSPRSRFRSHDRGTENAHGTFHDLLTWTVLQTTDAVIIQSEWYNWNPKSWGFNNF